MTLLRHYNSCPRSGLMYQANKGTVQNVAMVRGSAFHAICERATKLMVEQGEPVIPPELVKDIVGDVLTDYAVPMEEHDRLREMTYRWATEWAIEPSNVIACEDLFVLDVAGWKVRAKVDFAELRLDGRQLYIGDYKSGAGAPNGDDVGRKRPDGSLSAKSLQLIVYALAVKYGKRVIVDAAGNERPEPSPAARAQEMIGEYVFAAIEDSEGHMLRRTVGLTALEMSEYLESLKALVTRLGRAEQSGDWPAIVSSAGCAECPCPSRCPIPADLREHNGTITDVAQAASMLEAMDRRKDDDSKQRAAIKAWAKENDVEIRFGADKVARFVLSETERIDKDAVLEAVRTGRPLLRDTAIKVSRSTNFKDVKLTESELEEAT